MANSIMTEVSANDDLSCLKEEASHTTNFVGDKLQPTYMAINDCLNSLGDDVFQGPAADSCKKGLESFMAVIKNPIIVNFEKLSSSLTETYTLLVNADNTVKDDISFVYDENSGMFKMNAIPNLKASDAIIPVNGFIENYGQRGGGTIQTSYGGAHNGVDITAPMGTNIYAPTNARVAYVGNNYEWGYGNCVVLEFYSPKAGKNMAVIMAHMREVPNLRPGQVVSTGTVIGHVGSSGYVVGAPHLHMEIRDHVNYAASRGSYSMDYLYGHGI